MNPTVTFALALCLAGVGAAMADSLAAKDNGDDAAGVDLSSEGPADWTADYRVYRGGPARFGAPPDAAALAAAKERGIATVIDLRGPEEGTAATAALVEAAGLAHHAVPFPKGAPFTHAAVRRVAEIVAAAPPGSVLVHCASGQRAAAWWAADLVADHGVPVETALTAARAAGLEKEDTAAAVRRFAVEERARRLADAAANRLAATLMGRLQAAIDEGGVVAGARVCADVAQDITAEVGRETGVSVRRTALRLRNPANAPDDFERAWLEAQPARIAAGQGAEAVYTTVGSGDEEVLRHLRPILFPGGVCTQCHGTEDEIPVAMKDFLADNYPQDQATGFRAGDLRGAISVKVPLQ